MILLKSCLELARRYILLRELVYDIYTPLGHPDPMKDNAPMLKSSHRQYVRAAPIVDRDERFVLRLSIRYLRRIIRRSGPFDGATLEFVSWILGDTRTETLVKELVARFGREEDRKAFAGADDTDDLHALAWRCLRRVRGRKGRAKKIVDGHLERRLRDLRYRGRAPLEAARRQVGKMLALSELEAEFAIFIYLSDVWPQFETFFSNNLECFRPTGRKHLAAALDITIGDLTDLERGRLTSLEVISRESYGMTISSEYQLLFEKVGDAQAASGGLFSKVPRVSLELDAHRVDLAETAHLLRLLALPSGDSSTHILLYGTPGTGKTSYARALIQQLGEEAFEVLPQQQGLVGTSRRAALIACINMTGAAGGPIVVVDEADALLNTTSSLLGLPILGADSEKAWVNVFLERSGLRMIWICNEIAGIDPSVRRRFAYSMVFRSLGRDQREAIWKSVAKRRGVLRLLPESVRQRLAEEYYLSAGIIDMAVRKAKSVAKRDRGIFLEALRRGLVSHDVLLRGGEAARAKEDVNESFLPEVLETSVALRKILGVMSATSVRLYGDGEGSGEMERRHHVRGLNALFHGPPGTGKSELARYLAKTLGRQVLIKRASDIKSKYVGESEAQLARAFREAENEESILIFDEVDSFLHPRDSALESWAIDLTNEFLTQLERFGGIAICTTNHLAGLDIAVLRRFQLKVFFDYLSEAGKEILYQKILAPLSSQTFGQEERTQVRAIGPLSGGDFVVVRGQLEFAEDLSHAELMKALEAETALRRGHLPAGFRAPTPT